MTRSTERCIQKLYDIYETLMLKINKQRPINERYVKSFNKLIKQCVNNLTSETYIQKVYKLKHAFYSKFNKYNYYKKCFLKKKKKHRYSFGEIKQQARAAAFGGTGLMTPRASGFGGTGLLTPRFGGTGLMTPRASGFGGTGLMTPRASGFGGTGLMTPRASGFGGTGLMTPRFGGTGLMTPRASGFGGTGLMTPRASSYGLHGYYP